MMSSIDCIVFSWVVCIPLLTSNSIYSCEKQKDCNIYCDNTTITNATNATINCSDSIINATISNTLSVSCSNNVYCNNMKILCPDVFNVYTENVIVCNIKCIGLNNICTDLTIHSSSSSTRLQCDSNDTNTINACNSAIIHLNRTNFQLYSGKYVICNSMRITDTGMSYVFIQNDGIINNITINLPLGTVLMMQSDGLYNNSFIDCSYCQSVSGSGISFIANTKLFALNARITFYINNTVFAFNDIYANTTNFISFNLYPGAYMTHNNIFVQNASRITVGTSIINPNNHVIFTNNNIYAQYADYMHFGFGAYNHGNNQIYAEHIKTFSFSSGINYDSKTLNINDYYHLMNAESVSIYTGGIGGILRNIYVNAMSAQNINITVNKEGKLYNATIIASNVSESFFIYCQNCNQLSLTTTFNKTTLICDGFGCNTLTIYTVNGAKYDDINVTSINCNCSDNIKTACIDEWEIYCQYNDLSNPSILSSATNCNGKCCGDILDMLHDDRCPWPVEKVNTKYYFIGGGLFVVLVAVLFVAYQRHKKSKDSELKPLITLMVVNKQ
eukprot:400827_1